MANKSNTKDRSKKENSAKGSSAKGTGAAQRFAKWITKSGKKWYQNWIIKNLVVAGVSMILLCVLLFYLAGLWTRHGSEFQVPDFNGTLIWEAEALADSAGLRLDVTDSVYLPHIKAGLILKQSPAPGSKVKRGRRILISINSLQPKMVEMPLVTGFFLREASSVLESNSLKVGKLIYEEDIASNNVLDQLYNGKSIRAGAKIKSQSEIDLKLGIASTDNTTFVPNMEGLPYSVVKRVLTDNSLNLGKTHFRKEIKTYSDSLNATVYKQEPMPADTAVTLGTYVTLYLK